MPHNTYPGLVCGHDTYSVAGSPVPFYYAAPVREVGSPASALPVVLVVHEIFGLHPYIAEVCRSLAGQGYLAVAPELFARQGDASQFTDIAQLMAELVARVPGAQVLADLDGAAEWAESHGGDAARMAVCGFCWGGRVSWLYCAHNPRVKAGVASYGRLVGPRSDLAPQQPVDIAASLHAPVLGLYGGQDGGIPLATVQEMTQALHQAAQHGNAAAAASQFHIYPQAGHAFHAAYRASYRADDAADSFSRALAWFAAHGVA